MLTRLKELIAAPRSAADSLADLNPWFALLPDQQNIVLCKDGSLVAGYRIDGQAIDGVDDDVLNNQVAIVNRALATVDDRITIWGVMERRFHSDYDDASYLNATAQLIENEWRENVLNSHNARFHRHLFLSYRLNITNNLIEMVRNEQSNGDANLGVSILRAVKQTISHRNSVAVVQGQLRDMVDQFTRKLEEIEGVGGGMIGLRRLDGDELLGSLFSRLNLASDPGPVNSQGSPYLDTLLSADTLDRVGDQLVFQSPSRKVHMSAISVVGAPQTIYSFHLDQLMMSPSDFILVQRFGVLPFEVAHKAIEKTEAHYRMEVKSLTTRTAEHLLGKQLDKINTGNLLLADDAQSALADLTVSNGIYGMWNMTVLALGSSAKECDDNAAQLASTLRNQGYTVSKEILGLMPAFLASVPGVNKGPVREYLSSIQSPAELLPLRKLATGKPNHQFFSEVLARDLPAHIRFPTDYGTTYDFSPHELDLGHSVVIGGPGSGKSTFMQLVISLFQKYYPCRTYVFDKDHSIAVMTVLLGGKHIEVSTKGRQKTNINPVLRMLQDNKPAELRRWIEVLIAAGNNGTICTPQESDVINAAILQTQELSPRLWRLSQIYALVAASHPGLAAKLAPYVDRSEDEDDHNKIGAFANYFDNDQDNFELTDIATLETGQLLKMPQVMTPLLDYVFYCIAESLDGMTPTLVYIEEAWNMLANEFFAQRMEDWLRTFRKKKAFLMFATQSVEEIAKLEHLHAFLSSVPTRIFFPSINSNVNSSRHMLESLFDFNEQQLNLLREAVPKRHALIVQSSGTKLVRVDAPELILRINAATAHQTKRDKALDWAHSAEPGWQDRYIKEVLYA